MDKIINTIAGLGMVAYIIIVAYSLAIIPSWPTNVYQLVNCDFQAPYKCEVVHGIGLVPIASPITVWLETGK